MSLKKKYQSWIFDCDGVLLQSNSIKSEAFFETALPYGKKIAEDFRVYHQTHGGISRYQKFHFLFQEILKKKDYQSEYHQALKQYGKQVEQKMLTVPETEGFHDLLKKIKGKKFVVSGGKQDELRKVFKERNFDLFFSEIFGSPDDKFQILKRELENGRMKPPGIFFGDSQMDYEAASEFGFDFVFVSDYTEFREWENYFKDKNVMTCKNLREFMEKFL